jgi:hypothetical protein
MILSGELSLRRDKIMIQNEVDVTNNQCICEAQGCFAVAEEEIKVPVGKIGEINLSVCSKCKPKFIPKYSE